MIGLKGIKVEHSAQIEGAFEAAFAADRPVVIDAMTDPNEPPIPPHITFKQMENMTRSVLAAPKAGIPGAIAAIRETAHEFLPGR
jgi:pyruvate dehydrogenase (quinone)